MDRSKFTYKQYNSQGGCYGVTTDIYLLPIGTKFCVINGAWNGEIIEEDGKKMMWIDTGRKVELKEHMDYGLVTD